MHRKTEEYKKDIASYKKKLSALQQLNVEAESQAKRLVKQQNELTIRWRNENRATIAQFEKTINSLKTDNQNINKKNLELQSRVSGLIHERNEAMTFQDLQMKKDDDYENKLTLKDEQIRSLKEDLSAARESETVIMHETKQLRKDLDKSEMEIRRLERLSKYHERKLLAQTALQGLDETFHAISKNPSFSTSIRDIDRVHSSQNLFAPYSGSPH